MKHETALRFCHGKKKYHDVFGFSLQFDYISMSLYKCRSSKLVQVIGLSMANAMKIGQLDTCQKTTSLSRRDKSLVELSDNWYV
jgi:hypothetical protein